MKQTSESIAQPINNEQNKTTAQASKNAQKKLTSESTKPNTVDVIPNIAVANSFAPLENQDSETAVEVNRTKSYVKSLKNQYDSEKIEETQLKHKGFKLVQGTKDILPNFYKSPVVFNGITHPTAEHAYQHAKALKLKNTSIANQIKNSDCPYEAKRLGKTIQDDDNEWCSIENSIMSSILECKADQKSKFCTGTT